MSLTKGSIRPVVSHVVGRIELWDLIERSPIPDVVRQLTNHSLVALRFVLHLTPPNGSAFSGQQQR
jgi:hypothetical protein